MKFLCIMLAMFLSTALTQIAKAISQQECVAMEDSVYRLVYNNGHFYRSHFSCHEPDYSLSLYV